jgi:4-aminobutyrate aminotransferase-like enzyme
MGNVLTFTPPLVTTRAQLDEALDIVDACLTDVERAPGRAGGPGTRG